MLKKFSFRSLTARILGVVLLTNHVLAPSYAGIFSRSNMSSGPRSTNLAVELGALRTAYTFSDDKFKPETVARELDAELDAAVGEKYFQENKSKITPEKKQAAITKYLSALTAEEKEAAREAVYKSQPEKYGFELPGQSFEDAKKNTVWRRTNEKSHAEIISTLKLTEDEVQVGRRDSHYLDEKHVPFGGNFFPDNLGGIARRWHNNSASDEIFDYDTFSEKAAGRVNARIADILDNMRDNEPEKYEAFKDKCQQSSGFRKSIGRNMNVKITCFKEFNPEQTYDITKEEVLEKLKLLSQHGLNRLSPTEKYDIVNGYYDFRTTMFEKYYKGKRRKETSKNAPFLTTLMLGMYWEGRCNADRACGICNRHEEPVHQLSVDVAELVDKQIVFEPLDIKALFMSTYFYVQKYSAMGIRNVHLSTAKRIPPNMAAFDVLLRGAFGKYNLPFVIDNHPDYSVNNVTVVGFKRKVTSIRPLTNNDKFKLQGKVDAAKQAAIDNDGLPKDTEHAVAKDYTNTGNADEFSNELSLYSKLTEATKVMRVKVDLKILTEVPVDKANGPTKKKIAEKGSYTKQEPIEYELYLTDDNRIVEGQFVGGNLDFVWFADGRGTEEEQEDGNTFIKFDVMKDLASKSSKSGQLIDRSVFPGFKAPAKAEEKK